MIEIKISDFGTGDAGRFLAMCIGFSSMAAGLGAYLWWIDHRGSTSISIPDDLANQVKEITGEKSKTKAVISVLRGFIREKRG